MSHHYAIFSARYAPLTGGVESYTQNLARELVAKGHSASVVTSRIGDAPARETQDDGVEVYRLPCHALMSGRLPISRRTRAYGELMRELEGAGVDRVLVNTRFYRHSLEGLRFARSVGAPVVVLDHGSAYLVLGNAFADAMLRTHEHAMTRRGKRFAPRYAGVSKASARWLETFGISTNTVLPNAIDARAFREAASRRDFRAEYRIDGSQLLVVFVGRLTPEKGPLQLAEAATMLGESFVCVMAGEGSLRSDIEHMGAPNVHLTGSLGREDLSALLSQGDLFCLPSRSEGFCTSLLEAGAWGLTPLMPHVGGVDEVMGNPVRFGSLLPKTDPQSIARALERARDCGMYGHLCTFEQHVAENCSWGATVHALENAFESAVLS